MAVTPNFAKTPFLSLGLLSTANTNRNGTGTIVHLLSASNSGSLVERITVTAIENTTAGMVRIFISGTAGVQLYQEIPVQAVTPSATVPVYRRVVDNPPLILSSGTSLYASTHNAEQFSVVVQGGHFE